MAAPSHSNIPVLTEIIAELDDAGTTVPEIETLIAELQTRLASRTFALTEELMRSALAELEATLHEQISSRLRRELPELIDDVLRQHLAREPEEDALPDDEPGSRTIE